jgi:hypothetical protein
MMSDTVALQRLTNPKLGTLCVAECGREVPFGVQRVFHIFDMPVGTERGGHAHRAQHQFLIAMHGAMEVLTRGREGEALHRLEDPGEGLYVPPMTWVVIRALAPESVLLVLASHAYDEADYIRDPAEFAALIA